MKYTLKAEEQKLFDEITEKYYMKPIIEKIEEYILKYNSKESLNYLYEILKASKDKVDILLEKRKENGEIKDISQARKSIVGAAFSNSIIYLFLLCKQNNLVNENIFITNKTKDKIFVDMVTINVDGETQKPDMDLIIYSTKEDNTLRKCMIVCLQASPRSKIEKTYKWKLLMEIASSCNEVKQKYNISYDQKEMPLICFATVNFYDEINNPQHRGMFKFFDSSFIGKPLKADFISNLAELIDFANTKLLAL
jgi:type II restriction enzyme